MECRPKVKRSYLQVTFAIHMPTFVDCCSCRGMLDAGDQNLPPANPHRKPRKRPAADSNRVILSCATDTRRTFHIAPMFRSQEGGAGDGLRPGQGRVPHMPWGRRGWQTIQGVQVSSHSPNFSPCTTPKYITARACLLLFCDPYNRCTPLSASCFATCTPSVLGGKSRTFVCGATRKQTQPPSCSSSSRLYLRRRCSGSVQWTHANCLKRWLESRPGGLPRTREGEVISSILSCEVCNGPYSIKIVQQPEWTAQRCLQKHQPLNLRS